MHIFHKIMGCLLAAAFCLLAGCRRQAAAAQGSQVTVTLGQLQKRIVKKHLPAKGVVQPIDSAVISAGAEGAIVNMNIVEGDYAKAGDVLFCIDRTRLQDIASERKNEIDVLDALLERAKVKAENAELTFKQLERDYERERKLREANVNSLASFEAAETAWRKATLDVMDAKLEVIETASRLQKAHTRLAAARRELEKTMVVAPYDCVVTERFAEPHEYVTCGRNILKIENHDRLQVVCNLDGVHYDDVAVGRTRAEILVKGQSVCSGVVMYKSPSIDTEKQTFKLKIALPKNTTITGGLPCDVKLIQLEKEAWCLPQNALVMAEDGYATAFVSSEDGTAKSVQVVPGIVDGIFTEIVNAQQFKNIAFIISSDAPLADGIAIAVGARQ